VIAIDTLLTGLTCECDLAPPCKQQLHR
jgi:hypothetical protein